MKRPLVWALASYIFGVLFVLYVFGASGHVNGYAPALCLTAGVIISIAVLLCLKLIFRLKAAVIAVFFVYMLMGFIFMNKSLCEPPELPDGVYSGAADVALTASGRQRVIFETDINGKKVSMLAYLPPGTGVVSGQYITLYGKPDLLEHARNPGAFDEHNYYRSRKISYKIFAAAAECGDIKQAGIFVSAGKRLSAVYDSILPENEASIIKAMIIGDKVTLGESTKELYKSAGIYHILAISGLHISIITMALNLLLKRFLNYKASGAVTLGLIICYCVMTGSSISTVRAVIMCGVVIAGDLLDRERDLLTSISFACLCLLVYEPLYILDIGFQLSFSAVYGICLLSEPVEIVLMRINSRMGGRLFFLRNKYITGLLSATTAAVLATSPIQCFHFYYFYPYALLVNLIIVPTVFVVAVTALAAGVIGLFSTSAALFPAGVVYFALQLYEAVCKFFVMMPFAEILTGCWGVSMCIVYYFTVLAAAYVINGGKREYGARKKYMHAAAAAFSICICLRVYEGRKLTVTMLDVGQGDCFAILKNGYAFIIDGGGLWGRGHGSNTGVNVLIPYLDYKGIRRLNGLFVTHADGDHAAGIAELIEYGGRRVDALYVTSYVYVGELGERLLNLAAEHKIDVRSLAAGNVLKTSAKDFYMECLYPSDGMRAADINDTSLVMRVVYRDTSFLFTGDISGLAENTLVGLNGDLTAGILKVPHHGSKYSSTEAFVAGVSPLAALVSSGKNNVYGFPSAEAIKVYESHGIPVFNTGELGAVTVEADGKRYVITSMLKR